MGRLGEHDFAEVLENVFCFPFTVDDKTKKLCALKVSTYI